jgi:hypothetical protein
MGENTAQKAHYVIIIKSRRAIGWPKDRLKTDIPEE